MKSIYMLLLAIVVINARAQKLPNVQQGSLYAPANIKIDGKATEWDNKFQAYNNATDIFYTVSNDDDNLYLTVQVTDRTIINKIISGGITFTINPSEKKGDKNGVSITYPVFEKNGKPDISINSKEAMDKNFTPPADRAEAIVTANNTHLAEKSKLIMVTGLKDLDTLISVYNQDGIKAAELFDNKMAYTYELGLSLKRLGLEVGSASKFVYHIKLNGASIMTTSGYKISMVGGGDGGAEAPTALDMAKINLDYAMAGQSSAPTDFWGEYTLAKN